MDPNIIDELNSDHILGTARLRALLDNGILPAEDIDAILALKSVLIIADFLTQYQHFSKENIHTVHKFILDNLNHKNKLFVSDLIEFAEYWELELPYQQCIKLLNKFKADNTYVQLAMIDYLYTNLKLKHIDAITKALNEVLENPECNQSVQVKSAFFLFRITHKKKYLTALVDLVVNGDGNKTLLKNILLSNFNGSDYFEYYDLLHVLVSNEND